ncbi:glycosyltransferase family 4 protein [Azospirillum sp. TSO22-1]|uniref:glycosyltransferase family 4 protein n=1 Tax=Azospirillum sp. TSO22-1 TaxID=716789 RepID=UPI0011B6C292|nr:glycosyltransferase family 4 protein [Azospirillum sp. TSO22-1]
METLARLAAVQGRPVEAALAGAEARRWGGGGDAEASVAAAAGAAEDPRWLAYREALRRDERPSCGQTRRVVIVTNLFPPQEFGGYGRKMWEFAAELRRRGHAVRVLCADRPEFVRPGVAGDADLEDAVERSLSLYGAWEDGVAHLDPDQERIKAIAHDNNQRILDAAYEFDCDACLVGNLDMLANGFLSVLADAGVPVVHCIGNSTPSYSFRGMPTSPLFRLGPASHWVAGSMARELYNVSRATVLYPGARVDLFYSPFPPAFDRLRIAFASLFVDYKGPQVLVEALALLAERGVDFDCVFAGDVLDPQLFDAVRQRCEALGFGGRVRFQGFLDRPGMARLLARSNVLVFPSTYDEPFGISQVEAMAAGVTVVSSATGGSREIVRDGIDGLHFKNGDANDLADTLEGLAAAPRRWAELARAGQERALTFAVARTVDRIEALFEELSAIDPADGDLRLL